MNEATISAGLRKTRQQQQQQQRHLPRPRSGSWGNQELAYYKSIEHRPPSAATAYPSKFLSMSGAGSAGGSSKRPPLPLEMVQPEHLLSTPTQIGVPGTKKRTTRIRSIGQFFKSLSSKPVMTTTQSSKSSSSLNSLQGQRATPPVPPPKYHQETSSISAVNRQHQQPQRDEQETERAGLPCNIDQLISKLPAPNTSKRLPKCPTFHGSPLASGTSGSSSSSHQRLRPALLQRKTSEDGLNQQTRPSKKNMVAVRNDVSEEDDDDADVDDDHMRLDINQAQESQIASDRLSRRLSGGHFGSAGGLIISTTTTPISTIAIVDNDSLVLVNAPSPPDPPSPIPTEEGENDRQSSPCQQRKEEEQAAEAAKRIWEDDPTVYHSLEHIAEWMGDGKPLSTSILKHYFAYFDFTNQKLDEAFRKFCSKLHLKAETQQIDRVLGEFAHRYWDCNPFSIFANPDVVHAIIYSLLLLNTDLHVAQGDHRRMSQNAFVRNTLSAIQAHLSDSGCQAVVTFDVQRHRASSFLPTVRLDEDEQESSSTSSSIVRGSPSIGSKTWMFEIEALLREMYTSIRHRQIADPLASKTDEAGTSAYNNRRRSLQITAGRVGALKRSVGTIMWKSASNGSRESMVITEMIEATDSAIATSPTLSFHRRRSMSSMKSSASQTSHLTQTKPNAPPLPLSVVSLVAGQQQQQQQHHGTSTEMLSPTASAAPYYKEGLVSRKHLLERAGQRARHRDWKECFLVADRGEIRVYRPENDNRKSMVLSRNSIMLGRNYGTAEGSAVSADNLMTMGDDWLAHAELANTIDLKHTLANPLQSGYSRHRPHAFALQQSNGGVYVFQVGSPEEAVEWVTTCNYWAARESKEPLMGGVSNIEYGWGNVLEGDGEDEDEDHNHNRDDNDGGDTLPAAAVNVHEWHPPMPPTVQSALDEQAQLTSLHRHVQALNGELDQHRELKRRTELRFPPKTSQAARAMCNWENKSQYLLHEIIKYQNYCDAIERSLALQAKANCDDEDEEDEEEQ